MVPLGWREGCRGLDNHPASVRGVENATRYVGHCERSLRSGEKRKDSEITLAVQRRMNHLKSNMLNRRSRWRQTEDRLVGLLRRLEVEAPSC